MGRIDGDLDFVRHGHCRGAADRYRAGVGAAFGYAYREGAERRVYRVVARRSLDHEIVMASVVPHLLLPEGKHFDNLLRALIGIVMFQSAYMAEVVRGGLQAIPKGQYEGAMSLGLSFWKMMGLIVMPQALKIVIPGIVNTFIGLFKDTTLVLIIGLLDFLNSVQTATTNPEWSIKSVPYTGYAFVAIVFWVHCYGMAWYSRHLEQKLHRGHKR